MTTVILKDFRRRLDYDSGLTSKAERLKLGRPAAMRRTERMAAIGEAYVQMPPSTRLECQLAASLTAIGCSRLSLG
jgi:hypothetical protein